MTENQKQGILKAWAYCDEEDKSTEFMLQFMTDWTGLAYEEVVEYIASPQSTKDRENYYKKLKQ
jgi:hypothetical protein